MKADTEGFGLRTRNAADHIALRGVRLRSRLCGMSQRTTVEQTYVNFERTAIEALYTFPLPESAAVCGFEVLTGDRVLTGVVEEVEQAVERYDEAIGDGHGAFMVEANRPDVFTVRVGNLKPGQAVTVRLTYVCPLERADGQLRVAFPTTVAPRYVSAAATDPLDAMIDGDALNPPHVLAVPYGLTMEVDVDLGRAVKRITSPGHAIRVVHVDGHATRALVSFAGGATEMDRDVVLNIELPREHEPVVETAAGPDGANYLAVTFVPEFDVDDLEGPEPTETVFVMDCSGSMQGDSMRQATAALELCLRSLSLGDTFNVCRFGSTFELMSSEPLHYSEQTLQRAIAYVRQAADLGGTELYAALHAVLTPSPRVGTRRQVIVLTDGQVTNEPALLELARQRRPHNRIFSFGIGAACSTSLVKGLARSTGGAAEFITAGERIDEKVLRTFARLASPMVSDVELTWHGGDGKPCDVQTLAELPPVFDGDVLTVFGRAAGKLPRTATLSCRSRNGPAKWGVPVPAPSAAAAEKDGGVIATMWARRTIQSLEEVNGLQGRRYAPGKRSREADTLVNLSKQFGLLSGLTTFLAVEHRTPEERNDGRPALRRVPVLLAEGWGGNSGMTDVLAGAAACAMPMPMLARASLAPPARPYTTDSAPGAPPRKKSRGRRGADAGREGVGGALHERVDDQLTARRASKDYAKPPRPLADQKSALPPPPPEVSADLLRALLSLQSADGSFDTDRSPGATDPVDQAIRTLGHDPAEWGKRARTLTQVPSASPAGNGDRAARTATVLLVLRALNAGEHRLWRRAEQKAVRYLQDALDIDAAGVQARLKLLETTLLAAAPAAE